MRWHRSAPPAESSPPSPALPPLPTPPPSAPPAASPPAIVESDSTGDKPTSIVEPPPRSSDTFAFTNFKKERIPTEDAFTFTPSIKPPSSTDTSETEDLPIRPQADRSRSDEKKSAIEDSPIESTDDHPPVKPNVADTFSFTNFKKPVEVEQPDSGFSFTPKVAEVKRDQVSDVLARIAAIQKANAVEFPTTLNPDFARTGRRSVDHGGFSYRPL
jgi:hypothetical protein